MIAFRRTPNGPRVRSGVEFPDNQVVFVENPTEAMLNDPGLEQIEVSGPNDPKLANLTVRKAEEEPTPDPEREITDDEARAYADQNGLALVAQKEFDALKGERDRLEADKKKLETYVSDLEDDLKSVKEKAKSDAEAHKIAITELKAKHAEELKAAQEKKGDKPK